VGDAGDVAGAAAADVCFEHGLGRTKDALGELLVRFDRLFIRVLLMIPMMNHSREDQPGADTVPDFDRISPLFVMTCTLQYRPARAHALRGFLNSIILHSAPLIVDLLFYHSIPYHSPDTKRTVRRYGAPEHQVLPFWCFVDPPPPPPPHSPVVWVFLQRVFLTD